MEKIRNNLENVILSKNVAATQKTILPQLKYYLIFFFEVKLYESLLHELSRRLQ